MESFREFLVAGLDRVKVGWLVGILVLNVGVWLWYLRTRPVPPPTTVQACVEDYTKKLELEKTDRAQHVSRVSAVLSDKIGQLEKNFSACQSDLTVGKIKVVEAEKKVELEREGCKKRTAELAERGGYIKRFLDIVERKCDADYSATRQLEAARALSDKVRGNLLELFTAYDALRKEPQKAGDGNVVARALLELLSADADGLKQTPYDHYIRIGQYLGRFGNASASSPLAEFYLPHLNRSSDTLRALFEANKHIVFALISKEAYRTSNFRLFVHGLRFSHVMISPSLPGAEAIDIQKVNSVCKLDETENIRRATKDLNADFAVTYTKSLPNLQNWLCTFWLRRAMEENDAAVIDILNQIATHYGDPYFVL